MFSNVRQSIGLITLLQKKYLFSYLYKLFVTFFLVAFD